MTQIPAIFLFEDNPADAYLVRLALLEENLVYDLWTAEDGDAAASLLNRIGLDLPVPAVVLMDLNIPKVEGQGLLRMIRKHPLCAEVPVIVVTSSDSPQDRRWTARLGVQAYFCKPTDLDEFLCLGELVRNVAFGPKSAP